MVNPGFGFFPERTSTRRAGLSGLITISLVLTVITSLVVGYMLFLPNILQSRESFNAENRQLRSQPEYSRQLREVVVTLAKRDSTLKLQHETLAAMPHYTRIILLLPEDNLGLIRNEVEHEIYRDQIEFVTYESISLNNSRVWLLFPDKEKLVEVVLGESDADSHNGSVWAQDLFEPMIDSSGRAVLVQPELNKWYSIAGTDPYTKVVPDNMFLKKLSGVGLETLRAPLAFYGGNILTDETPNGNRIAFCGSDILSTTRTVRKTFGKTRLSDDEIVADLKDALNVDQVVVMPAGRAQPYLMYHLDQAMLLLSNKVVAIPRLVGSVPEKPSQAAEIREVESFLSELRSTIQAIGYLVVDIETSVQNILRCQHYVNAIPYTNAETGQKTVMMPVFRSAQEDNDLRLIDNNTATLESLGYEVIHVLTNADEYRGGIHCLVNVIY